MDSTTPSERASMLRNGRRLMLVMLLASALPYAGLAGAEIYQYQDAQGNWVFTDRPPPEVLESRTGTQPTATQGMPAGPTPPSTGLPAVRRAPPAEAPNPSAIAVPRPYTQPPYGPTAASVPPPALAPAPRVAPSEGLLQTPGQPPRIGASGTALDAPAPQAPASVAEAAPPLDLKRNLEARLMQRFQPVSPVEMSSLAVVTIHSELGSGSGFFVSSDGLLLTNRHVVRPPEDWAAEERAALAELKHQLETLEKRLSLPRDRYSDPNDYDRGQRLLRERTRTYRQAKRALEMKRNAALLQRAFEIELKDGETLSADLVDVSAQYDLALLRVPGYRTPYLRPLLGARLHQTQDVYAIGSPLGIQDTVTAGTYTGQRDGMLVTDARIMPGSSGGPLVNAGGAVLGVNTWKATPGPDAKARGFGVSIPIDVAFREFPDLHARERDDGTTAGR